MREGSVIDSDLAQDFPMLAVLYATRDIGGRVYRRASKERLGLLSDRIGGELVASMRQEAVPGAFRAFARQIGLDPDADELPLERTLMTRIRAGRFVPDSAIEDPCTVAMLETGVPVWTLDDDEVTGPLRLGVVRGVQTERLDGTAAQDGDLAVWDAERPVAVLLGERAATVVPQRTTRRVRLYAIRVEGVSDAAVREALWTASELTGPAT
jgi:DNA/RNA-binding domain of Phe-tRNA-synthetase-like protein